MFTRGSVFLLTLMVAAAIYAQASPPTEADASASTDARAARCADIAAMGSQYGPLASACNFVLSPGNLPNYICEERMERFVNDRELDVVTAEVTYTNGHDRYANLAINGNPVESLAGSGGWGSLALFGTQLSAIFRPETKTRFKAKREIRVASRTEAVFDYQFLAANNTRFHVAGSLPGLAGSITIDEDTGELRRVDAALSPPPAKRSWTYNSIVKYGVVSIPDLGPVLTPQEGEVKACNGMGACFRNVLTFHDCRKFGSTVRMVPAPEEQP